MVTRRTDRTPKPAAAKRPTREAKPAEPDAARIRELIDEATVDANGDDEARMGLFTMLQENLAVPFETMVLGVPVQVTEVELNDAEEVVAVCKSGRHTQRIGVVDLALPQPPPEGSEWIAAYRKWRGG